jgi:hypothetical protein
LRADADVHAQPAQRGALRLIDGECDLGAVEYGWLYR